MRCIIAVFVFVVFILDVFDLDWFDLRAGCVVRRAQRSGSQDRTGFRGFRWIVFVEPEPGDPDGSYRDPNRRDASRGGDAHGDGLESVFRRDDEHDALPRQRGSGSDPGW